jgi:hypothetical protein
MTSVDELLIGMLAQVDAMYEPIWDVRSPAWSALWQLRWAYPQRGMPWRGHADKQAERDLTAAIAEGLVLRRKGRQKTTGVRLTDRGLRRAWELVGIPADQAIVVAAEVARLAGIARRWVPEIEFNNNCGWGDGRQCELKLIAFFHRPALTSGYVASNCDYFGRVGYAVTDAGQAALDADGGEPAPDPPDPEPGMLDTYVRTYQETIY